MKIWAQKLLKHDIIKNVLTLSGAQIATYIFPLITLPYLTRVLGPSGWGIVAFGQSFGYCISLPVEYGHKFSGTRDIARYRDHKNKISEMFSGILGVKVLMAVIMTVVGYLVHDWFIVFHQEPLLLWSSIFFGLAFSSSLLWFYEGLECMRFVAAVDISTKAISTIFIFIFIHVPEDSWKVLALQGLTLFLSTIFILTQINRRISLRIPNPQLIWKALKSGWPMFLFRSSESSYQMGTAFLLGLFASPVIVGYYSGADRIAKIFVGFLLPINRALFPRMSHLLIRSRKQAIHLFRKGFVATIGIALIAFTIITFMAPIIVKLLLGREFDEAVPILKILALLPVMVSLKHVFGFQWTLALGLDRIFNIIIITSGILSLILVLSLVPYYFHYGMAWVVISTELIVSSSLYLYLKYKSLDPLTLKF